MVLKARRKWLQNEEVTLWIKTITSCMVRKIYKGYYHARVWPKSRIPNLVHTKLRNMKGDNIVGLCGWHSNRWWLRGDKKFEELFTQGIWHQITWKIKISFGNESGTLKTRNSLTTCECLLCNLWLMNMKFCIGDLCTFKVLLYMFMCYINVNC